jgi:Domain of unknown function (DUF4157)
MKAIAPALMPTKKSAAPPQLAEQQSDAQNTDSFANDTQQSASCACGGDCPNCNSKKKTSSGILQKKLRIGASDDIYEQEADRVADQILAMPIDDPAIKKTPVRIQRLANQSATHENSAPNNVTQVLSETGRPLDAAVQKDMGQRFGHDFSHVRIHSDTSAEQSARKINANAYTSGHNIVFGSSQFAPTTQQGRRLLAHELTHVVQQSGSDSTHIHRQPDANIIQRDGPDDDSVADPIATWERPTGSLLLVFADDRLILLPARPLVRVADAESQRLMSESSAHMTTDLGALLEVPPVGAGATRVFRAGRRTALIIDAGSDPAGRIPAAVYLNEFQGVMASLGVTNISEIRAIHVHQDHINEIPTLVANSTVSGARVSIPHAFLGANAAIQRVVASLRTTTDPAMLTRGFGAAWTPNNPVAGPGTAGDVFRFGYTLGELRVEALALRSALRTTSATPDLASFMTKVTRPADRASIVVLGDLRGRDLGTIRDAMETQRAGSWNEFFSGVSTISGFSHHAGRLEDRDINGIMSLLDATMLREGRLRVVEQTTTTRHTRARTDTLELLQRLGIEVAVAELPSTTATSGAGATRSSLYARGPSASVRSATPSPLANGLLRIERMRAARATIETWRPWFEETGGASARTAIEALLPELQSSETSLRQSVRAASEAALRVRSGGTTAASGARDYTSATGGARATVFETAVTAIPATTPAETSLTAEGFARLESLRALPTSEIPLRVLLHAAIVRGEYSDRAFAHMLAALEPDTRTRLLTGRRGGPSPRIKAFERVRAEFNFRQSVLGSGDTYRMPRSWGRGRRTAGAAVAWLQIALELWNNIGQPLLEAHETSVRTFRGQNLLPFIRRLMFWDQAGARPSMVGVVDPTLGALSFDRDYDNVLRRLQAEELSALYFEAPVLSDADVIRFGVWLAHHVRNFDEFSLLFNDSGQDSVRWQNASSGGWQAATWQVRSATYETSGENHVVESWHEHPTLTRLMQTYVQRIITNTSQLIDNWRSSSELSPDREAELGRLEMFSRDRPLYESSLRDPSSATTELEIQPLGSIGAINSSTPNRLTREVTWWSPPRFFVYGVSDNWAEVSGADYNTYAILRRLTSERHTVVAGGSVIGADQVTRIGNEGGKAWIRADLLIPRTTATPSAPATAPLTPIVDPHVAPPLAPSRSPVHLGPLTPSPRDELGPSAPGTGGLTVEF